MRASNATSWTILGGPLGPSNSERGPSGTASATFVQSGDRVDGPFQALACGVDGTFHGRVSGNTLTGTVGMLGCTGGTVTGHLDNGALSLTITDFRKDLIAGDVEVLPGGQVTMQR